MVGAQPVVGFAELHQNSILETLALEASPQSSGRRSNLNRGTGTAAVAIAARKNARGNKSTQTRAERLEREREREREREGETEREGERERETTLLLGYKGGRPPCALSGVGDTSCGTKE